MNPTLAAPFPAAPCPLAGRVVHSVSLHQLCDAPFRSGGAASGGVAEGGSSSRYGVEYFH